MNHLPAKKTEIAPYVLLPGDPARVEIIGTYLTEFRLVGQKREYAVGNGFYRNIPVSVVSTGIGCPSTAIAVEELVSAGARYLIRVGTCGGAWRSDIPAGSLIIPTACVRDEGTTREYIPSGFPAVANVAVVNALCDAAKSLGENYFAGINRTHDSFYSPQKAIIRWGRYLAEARFKDLESPILSSDMESAALFVIASLLNVSAGAVLAVNGNPEPLKERVLGKLSGVEVESSPSITMKSVDSAIRTALEALRTVSNS